MLKFIKHHLDTIAGVSIYPVLSFLIFFSLFIVVLLWVRKVSNAYIAHMADLPLMEEASNSETGPHAY